METTLAERLTYPLLVNQVARIDGQKVVIDIFRGSKTLRNQRKVAEIEMSLHEALEVFDRGQSEWYRHVQRLDFDLNIPYSRFD